MHLNTSEDLPLILFPLFLLQNIKWDGVLPKASLSLTWIWELEFVNFSNLGMMWRFNHLFSINWHCNWINEKVVHCSIRNLSLRSAGRGSIHMTAHFSLSFLFKWQAKHLKEWRRYRCKLIHSGFYWEHSGCWARTAGAIRKAGQWEEL